MYRTTKAKRFTLVVALTLTLALLGAPQVMAGPITPASDLGSIVYGWLTDLWSTLSEPKTRSVSLEDSGEPPQDEYGPGIIPNGLTGQTGDEREPMPLPNR